MATKRKTTTAIVAGVTALALLLGGTFAWTSISQTAKNEAIVDINPGGRLHDDFNGTNKDVYVENFGDDTTGVDIFARIRLDQYFEVGQDAGINKDGTNRKVTQVLGTDINKVETWEPYIPTLDENGNINFSELQANDNWQWKLGNDDTNMPYYMPTFNMNKDSLAADINGTYEGKDEGDIVHYDDYTEYGADSKVTGTEVYDWDDEDADEETDPTITKDETTPRDSADVYHKENQEHTAQQISTTATVITMDQWLALCNDDIEGNETGNFWVYDTDGWAYWAQPIAPETTTGLLLDSINMSRVPDDNYYYGINVVGQFATASDWELLYSTGDDKDAMTDNAQKLMGLITKVVPAEDDDNTTQTLVLTPAGGLVYADIDEAINITYDITDYVDDIKSTPDISTITVTYDEFDEANDGQAVPTPLTTDQYTYSYDPDTGMGTLTITDPNLDEYYLTVKDSTGEVRGDIDLSTPSTAPDYYENGTLNLRTDRADTETVTVGTGITVEFDTTDLDSTAEGYVDPDFENLTLTYTQYADENDETGTTVTLTADQYTYTYDETAGKGTLTITDETLVGESLYVTDGNDVLDGDVNVTSEDEGNNETYQELVLDADGTNSVTAGINEGIKITTEDETADLSSVKVYYWVSETEGEATEQYLTEGQYTYEDGILTITDASLESTVALLIVTDANETVSGKINLDYTHDVDPDEISIGYVPQQDGFDGTLSKYGTDGYMKPGEYMQLTAAATVDGEYNSDIIVSDEDVWTVTGATSESTTVDENGKLTIGTDESTTLHLITVKVEYRGHEATESYWVSGGLTATITEVNNAETYTTDENYQFTYSIFEGETDVTNKFENWQWNVAEIQADGYAHTTETATIDENGNFIATAEGTYEIYASADNYFGPTLTITVTTATEPTE